MPLTDRALSQTVIVADHERRLRRMRTATGGFDPNEDPVIIGAGATAGGGSTPDAVGGGEPGGIAIGLGANVDSFSSSVGTNGIAIGNNAGVGGGAHTGGDGNIAVGYSSQSGGFADDDSRNTAVGWEATAQVGSAVAVGARATAEAQYAIAIGSFANAGHTRATAIGANAGTTQDHQIMLGTDLEFVEIPGDSSTAPNGLVLTDTATGTRYIVQITSGALVLGTAP